MTPTASELTEGSTNHNIWGWDNRISVTFDTSGGYYYLNGCPAWLYVAGGDEYRLAVHTPGGMRYYSVGGVGQDENHTMPLDMEFEEVTEADAVVT